MIHTAESMGFTRIDCRVADVLRSAPKLVVGSSLTDPCGSYGEPVIFTEWGIRAADGSYRVVMREIRWPDDAGRGCQHWVPAPGFDYKSWEEEA